MSEHISIGQRRADSGRDYVPPDLPVHMRMQQEKSDQAEKKLTPDDVFNYIAENPGADSKQIAAGLDVELAKLPPKISALSRSHRIKRGVAIDGWYPADSLPESDIEGLPKELINELSPESVPKFSDEAIEKYIIEHPGVTAAEIADTRNQSGQSIAGNLSRLKNDRKIFQGNYGRWYPETQPGPEQQAEDDHDPLIEGLFLRLPTPGQAWSAPDRERWLTAATAIFDLLYTGGE